MSFLPFLGREKELGALEKEHGTDRPSFTVIYGRRRVGKTRLIREFLWERSGMLLEAISASKPSEIYEEFLNQLARQAPDLAGRGFRADAEGLLGMLEVLEREARIKGIKVVVALDEFPRLVRVDPSVASRLQVFWDRLVWENRKHLHLIVCGSSQSIMHRVFFHGAEPLFGRRTLSIRLEPLSFEVLASFASLDYRKAFAIHSVLGGLPYYWQFVDWERTEKLAHTSGDILEFLSEFVAEHIYHELSPFLDEPDFVLREEVESPNSYWSVLRAVARNYSSLYRIIAEEGGFSLNELAPYLSRLIKIGLVRKEPQPFKSKKAFYAVNDPFLAFWFSCVEPFLPEIMLGKPQELVAREAGPRIKKHLERWYEVSWRAVLYPVFRSFEAGVLVLKDENKKQWEIDFAVFDAKTKELLLLFEATFWKFGENKRKQLQNFKEIASRILGAGTGRTPLVALSPVLELDPKKTDLLHFDFPHRENLEKLFSLATEIKKQENCG